MSSEQQPKSSAEQSNSEVTAQTGKTPLHIAVQYGHIDVAKQLLGYGAVYNIKDNDGKTPSQYAQTSELKVLFDSVKKLFKEVKDGNEEEVSKLLNKEVADAKEDHPDCITRHWVVFKEFREKVENGMIEEVTNLLTKEIVNAKENNGGFCALHWAAYNEHESIVSLLLKSGADAASVTDKGNTPLHLAVLKGNEEIVRMLLDHVLNTGENLIDYMNAKTSSAGNSALHVACRNNFFYILVILLRHGAAYNIKNIAGQTPLDLSTDQQVTQLLKIIDELFEDAKNGNVQINNKLRQVGGQFLYYMQIVLSTLNEERKTIDEVASDNKH